MIRLVFISGKITCDTPEYERECVALACDVGQLVRSLGLVPLIPHIAVLKPTSAEPEAVWRQAMGDSLAMMARCDAVLMLPNWRRSRGARIERWVAARRGMPVYDSVIDLMRATRDPRLRLASDPPDLVPPLFDLIREAQAIGDRIANLGRE